MRVLIHEDFSHQITGRLGYYYEVFGIYWSTSDVRNGKDCFVQLQSMPKRFQEDVILIVGHNEVVERYLKGNGLKDHERKIVLITCQHGHHFEKYKNTDREIYIAKQNDTYADILEGKKYHLLFDPVESELISYNLRRRPTEEIISKAYIKL